MTAPYDSYDYQSYWQGRSLEDLCERLALKKLLPEVKRHSFLVDVGGGFGRLADLYVPVFEHCLIVDPAKSLLDEAKQKLGHFENVDYLEGSLPHLSLRDKSLDLALVIRVSHHLPDLEPSLRELARILSPDGYLILEIANKIHFLARLKAYLIGNFAFSRDLTPIERRSTASIAKKMIPFSNHHPKKVVADLKNCGFEIKEILSVSNFRNPFVKKLIPKFLLLYFEDNLQRPLGRYFFGPSIFILAQKK